ncbi:MAG: nuclear transport factor 2 family protein [Cyclobacteriaceae bacterium]
MSQGTFKFLVTAFILCPLWLLSQGNDPKKDIETLLGEFLSNVDQKEMHDRFWGADLIYTSSSGTRFGKSDIMSGFDDNETESTEEDDAPKTSYTSEDITIKVFDDIAVLTFILVGKTTYADSIATSRYLNSGTLIQREGAWKVTNWHATKSAE